MLQLLANFAQSLDMKTLLVVITTLAVILALARCCFAAGGDHATAEIPTAHLTILITK